MKIEALQLHLDNSHVEVDLTSPGSLSAVNRYVEAGALHNLRFDLAPVLDLESGPYPEALDALFAGIAKNLANPNSSLYSRHAVDGHKGSLDDLVEASLQGISTITMYNGRYNPKAPKPQLRTTRFKIVSNPIEKEVIRPGIFLLSSPLHLAKTPLPTALKHIPEKMRTHILNSQNSVEIVTALLASFVEPHNILSFTGNGRNIVPRGLLKELKERNKLRISFTPDKINEIIDAVFDAYKLLILPELLSWRRTFERDRYDQAISRLEEVFGRGTGGTKLGLERAVLKTQAVVIVSGLDTVTYFAARSQVGREDLIELFRSQSGIATTEVVTAYTVFPELESV